MRVWLALLLCIPAAAQPVSIGVSTGALLTEVGESARFVIGPSARLRARNGFGVEAGALRRQIRYDFASGRP